ncbi:hypothetical protein NQ314_007693, partial [Rhamnusium bicolor]
FCHVGRLSHEVGWKYQSVVRTLESKRKVKAVLSIRKRDKLKKLTKAASEKGPAKEAECRPENGGLATDELKGRREGANAGLLYGRQIFEGACRSRLQAILLPVKGNLQKDYAQ